MCGSCKPVSVWAWQCLLMTIILFCRHPATSATPIGPQQSTPQEAPRHLKSPEPPIHPSRGLYRCCPSSPSFFVSGTVCFPQGITASAGCRQTGQRHSAKGRCAQGREQSKKDGQATVSACGSGCCIHVWSPCQRYLFRGFSTGRAEWCSPSGQGVLQTPHWGSGQAQGQAPAYSAQQTQQQGHCRYRAGPTG